MNVFRASLRVAVLCLIAVQASQAQPTDSQTASPDHIMVTPADVEWSPAPAVLPAGARVQVIEGNPAEAGSFALRLWLPAGYRIAPHFHPADEHITVISGTFLMGLGDTFDPAAGHALPAGSFAMMATGTRHYAWTEQETVVQLHGIGPWGLTYVNPADDPRQSQ